MENLPGHPKGPAGAGDHEAVGIPSPHGCVFFSHSNLGALNGGMWMPKGWSFRVGVRGAGQVLGAAQKS